MATGRRFLGGQVRLARRAWEDVAPELEFFLQRMWESEANGIPAGFNGITPETIEVVPGDPGVEGSGWAAADHVHPVSTAAATDLANANAEGSSTALSRADHKHKRDVRVKAEGVDVATRNALDFRATPGVTWTITDDPGNDEVDIEAEVLPGFLTTTAVSTTPYTVLATDFVLLVDATAGDITIELPPASDGNRLLHVKKVDASANKVIIDADGADVIDGDATQELLFEDEAVPLVSDAVSEWSVL